MWFSSQLGNTCIYTDVSCHAYARAIAHTRTAGSWSGVMSNHVEALHTCLWCMLTLSALSLAWGHTPIFWARFIPTLSWLLCVGLMPQWSKFAAIQTCWISFHHQIQNLWRDKYDLLDVLSLQILDHCRQRLRSSHSIILWYILWKFQCCP